MVGAASSSWEQKALLDQDKTHCLRLDVIASQKGSTTDTKDTVEFKAWYKDANGEQETALHEVSDFIKEKGQWFYIHPTISRLP